MTKNEILKILESAKDKNGDVPMRLVRQAFEKLPEPCEDAVSRAYKRGRMEVLQECDDIVSRKAVLNLLYDILDRVDQVTPVDHGIYIVARNSVDALPSATPKRKTGKWIEDMKRFGDDAYHCDQCGAILEEDALNWRNNYFCYHCGAKMNGRE